MANLVEIYKLSGIICGQLMEWIGIVLTNQKSKLTACVHVVVVMQGCVDVDVRICGVVFVIDLQPVFREYNNPEMN